MSDAAVDASGAVGPRPDDSTADAAADVERTTDEAQRAGVEHAVAAYRNTPAHTAAAEHDSSADGADHAVASGYSSTRRTPRRHKRVVRQGTELFDADGVKLEPGDMRTQRQREADDDRRILNELPPHWAVFNERE